MLEVIGQVDPVAMPPSPDSSSMGFPMGRGSFSTGGGTGRARVRTRLELLGHDEPVSRSDYVPFRTHILIRRGAVGLVPVGLAIQRHPLT